MANTLFRSESAVEYFKELVDDALANQRVEAGELTTYYVVNLLCGFLHFDRTRPDGDHFDDEPLAVRLGRALESGGSDQRRQLRRIGDIALFIPGFFSDSLRRKLVDVDYYASMGGYAYGSLSRREDEWFAPVFGELAEKFVAFVDILNEVSERSALTSNADVLRLYEKWLRTGSRRNGQMLVERGIVPNLSIESRYPQ
jgi:hypothetical protein